jgi:hypothetical protein
MQSHFGKEPRHTLENSRPVAKRLMRYEEAMTKMVPKAQSKTLCAKSNDSSSLGCFEDLQDHKAIQEGM